MKQVLLRVAAEWAEVSRREFAQPARRYVPLSREVDRAQDALDPHIDRKRAHPLKREEQRAVGDLLADARQPAQLRARGGIVQLRDRAEIDLARCDHARGAEKIFRAVTEGAGAKVRLVEARDRFRRPIGEKLASIELHARTEAP